MRKEMSRRKMNQKARNQKRNKRKRKQKKKKRQVLLYFEYLAVKHTLDIKPDIVNPIII